MISKNPNEEMKFSIITPAFNSANYIKCAMESVINSNYNLNAIQHIIVDDGSSDDTKKIVRSFQEKYPHIEYYSKQNGNWGSVINFAKKNGIVKHECVVILDSDDSFHKNTFRVVNKKMGENDIFIGSYKIWNGKREIIKILPYYWIFKRKQKNKIIRTPNTIPFTVFMKSKIFHGTPDLKEGVSYQDTILFNDAIGIAKKMRHTTKSCGHYWLKREGSTMADVKQEKSINVMYDNLAYLEKQQNGFICAMHLLAYRPLRSKLKLDSRKIHLKEKVSFKWFPWWIRWIVVAYFVLSLKKYFIIQKK